MSEGTARAKRSLCELARMTPEERMALTEEAAADFLIPSTLELATWRGLRSRSCSPYAALVLLAEIKGISLPPVPNVVKVFGVDFHSPGGALTLAAAEVNETPEVTGPSERTHADGWTIRGDVVEDYFYWVNDFEARHPRYGRVWGDFEKQVYADSREGFDHFYARHAPEAWDYGDI